MKYCIVLYLTQLLRDNINELMKSNLTNYMNFIAYIGEL